MSSHLTNEQLRLFGHWHRQFAAYLGSEVVNTALTESKTLSRPRFRDQDRPCRNQIKAQKCIENKHDTPTEENYIGAFLYSMKSVQLWQAHNS